MADMNVLKMRELGYGFIPPEHLPAGKNEYYLRNQQVGKPATHWRRLRSDERDALVAAGNRSDNWADVRVADGFDPACVRGCEFVGLVRLGRLGNVSLSMHGLAMPVGLVDSRIVSSDIGDNVVIRHVRHLSHMIVGNNVMLLNIDELHTTDVAKFGNGIVKDGEDESVRIAMDLINEAGGREVLPFDGMTPGDAYLWARYRGDAALMKRLTAITQAQFDSRRGYYGEIGAGSVIKHCRIIKDVRIGPAAYIKGANKLKNLTINSSDAEPTQIGEGVELVNGIIGRGCHVFYGCKAVRFVMGDHASLKYGARLIHSVLGDNSTVSCCELLNNLIFPAHEQHHNNSFLIASLIGGQSNIAAGATIGSNHNSRANDGEIHAGRGFWPGLCVTLKHSSRFASFTLIGKGDYPAELDIPLPFALVSNNVAADELVVMPAYWWLYNRYALVRNSAKFQARDTRQSPTQHVEFEAIAPDTVEEMFAAMRLLEVWTAKAHLRVTGKNGRHSEAALATLGQELLLAEDEVTAELEVFGEGLENSHRDERIIKPRRAYHAYREMIHHYAVSQLLDCLDANPGTSRTALFKALAGERETDWVNVGGQLMTGSDIQKLVASIRAGRLTSWGSIHTVYDKLQAIYPRVKQAHALASLLALLGVEKLTATVWGKALDEANRIQEGTCEQVYRSRCKDHDNPFRQAMFATIAEQRAVVGTVDDNPFVQETRQLTRTFAKRLDAARKRR